MRSGGLHVGPLAVRALDDLELRVLDAAVLSLLRVGRDARAVNHQRELRDGRAVVGGGAVERHSQRPAAARALGPHVRRHERPFGEAARRVAILRVAAQNQRPATECT